MDTILEETRKAEDALSESLRKRISECDTLREDLSKQSETLMNTERKMRELQGLLNTNENEQFPVQFELTKTQREKESLERQVTWLETELKTKSNEWLATKQALIIKGADTDSQLTTEKADNASKSQQIICLQVDTTYCVIYIFSILLALLAQILCSLESNRKIKRLINI